MVLSKPFVDAVHLLCYLDRESSDAVTPARAIEAIGIPAEQKARILSQLASAGLIQSVRGRAGGYRLMKHPEAISLADLFDVFGPADVTLRWPRESCPVDQAASCAVDHGLQTLSRSLRGMLASQTVASLLDPACGAPEESGGEDVERPVDKATEGIPDNDATLRTCCVDHLADGANVVGRRAAAATDDRHAD